jgi:hypothetical protein
MAPRSALALHGLPYPRWAHSGVASEWRYRHWLDRARNERSDSMASYMVVRHNVRNFAEWKAGYDAHLSKRVEAGLTEKHLLRGADDTNEVFLLFEARDLNRARGFAESADLRETMQKVGVVGKPDIYFFNG